MIAIRVRLASIVLFLAAAIWLYGADLGAPQRQPDELQLQSQAAALAAGRARDDAGRFLPVFIRATGDVWLPPMPVYASVLLTTLSPVFPADVRWAAVLLSGLNVALLFVLADQVLHRKPLAFAAAVLLLLTPAHFTYGRIATRDGIWQLPFILVWLIGLTAFLKNPGRSSRWTLALGAAALAGSAYSQPSAALMVPAFAAISIVALWRTGTWQRTDVAIAGAAFAAVLVPLVLWFAVYPSTYMDTFGRWLLHPAHLRSPIAWASATSNWLTLTVWSDVFWKFFAPSLLFFNPGAPGFCGVFLLPVAVLIAVGVREILRGPPEAGAGAAPVNVRGVILIGFLIGPLAVATFKEPPAIERALVMVPFGVLLAALGADALWARAHAANRWLAALLLIAVPFQFSLCYVRHLR
jgi:4-amino-4-deoxy-L-arabinose transferase-like glycosyltransferase